MPAPLFYELLDQESFQLVESRVPVTTPETDLFAGIAPIGTRQL
jgi:hypothetical protein